MSDGRLAVWPGKLPPLAGATPPRGPPALGPRPGDLQPLAIVVPRPSGVIHAGEGRGGAGTRASMSAFGQARARQGLLACCPHRMLARMHAYNHACMNACRVAGRLAGLASSKVSPITVLAFVSPSISRSLWVAVMAANSVPRSRTVRLVRYEGSREELKCSGGGVAMGRELIVETHQ